MINGSGRARVSGRSPSPSSTATVEVDGPSLARTGSGAAAATLDLLWELPLGPADPSRAGVLRFFAERRWTGRGRSS